MSLLSASQSLILFCIDGRACMFFEQVRKEEEQFIDSATDTMLVRGCLAGNQAAWTQLFQRYNRLIYKVPSSFGFSALEVEELYQEIAIEIIRSLPTLQDQERLHPWLVTIARRVCIRWLRSTPNYAMVDVQLLENEIERDGDTLDELLIRLEEYSLIRKALADLDPRCRALLTELFLKEQSQSQAEVALTLKMPIGSVGPTRSRCLEKLRERVELLS